MAQDYGAATDLIEGVKRAVRKTENAINKTPTADDFGKKDTTWHDSMVKNASESFRKDSANKRKVGGSDGKTGTEQKKPAAKKTIQRKRVAGK